MMNNDNKDQQPASTAADSAAEKARSVRHLSTMYAPHT